MIYLWKAAFFVDKGDDVERFSSKKIQDLLVVLELNVGPGDALWKGKEDNFLSLSLSLSLSVSLPLSQTPLLSPHFS